MQAATSIENGIQVHICTLCYHRLPIRNPKSEQQAKHPRQAEGPETGWPELSRKGPERIQVQKLYTKSCCSRSNVRCTLILKISSRV